MDYLGVYSSEIVLELFAASITLILFLSTFFSVHDRRDRSNIAFMALVGCNFWILMTDVINWIFLTVNYYGIFLKIFWTANYAILILNIICFYAYFYESTKGRISFVMDPRILTISYFIFTLGLWISSFWTGWFFSFDPNSEKGFVYGPYQWVAQMLAVMPLLILYAYMFAHGKKLRFREKMAWLSYGGFALLVVPFQKYTSAVVIYAAITLGVVLIYAVIIMDREQQIVQMQLKINEIQWRIIQSQIQPHFLYNALASISQLCRKDPKLAEEAIDKFADYLRVNLDSLKHKRYVPFEEELEHVETYMWLEQMRFRDKLKFEKVIETEDFILPILSVQPLVENAVKHGIAPKKKGGCVTLYVLDKGDQVDIVVKDDGVGFDVTNPELDDERSHIGMDSVKQRIETYLDSSITWKSSKGYGTQVIITMKKSKTAPKV